MLKHRSSQRYIGVDFRKNPELYVIGKGEEGVLLAEPYKSEILPHWRFKNPEVAAISAQKIYAMFTAYKMRHDFVGMDMARKYLQMGYTRAMRYARHRSGRKYDGPVPADKKGVSGAHGRSERELDWDPEKAESARIFWEYYDRARSDSVYLAAFINWREQRKHDRRAARARATASRRNPRASRSRCEDKL